MSSQNESEDDPFWAPSNFSDWNSYRIGGMLAFSLFFLCLLLWIVVGWVLTSKAKTNIAKNAAQQVLFVFYMICSNPPSGVLLILAILAKSCFSSQIG